MKEFRHETGNTFGDYVEAEYPTLRKKVALRIGQTSGTRTALLTRRDLTAIIAGLTAIRDAMPEGE